MRDGSNPEDQGSEYPDTECEIHWAPVAEQLRAWLHERRLEQWRAWKIKNRARQIGPGRIRAPH